MLSFEISNLSDHGPQHSTPVKELFLNKVQSGENSKHHLQTGRFAELSHVKVNDKRHRYFDRELLHHVDDRNETLSKTDFPDSIIDISQISEIQNTSVHGCDISDTVQGSDNVTVFSDHDLHRLSVHCNTVHGDNNVIISSNEYLVHPASHSTRHTKQTPGHQNQHTLIDNTSLTFVTFKHAKLEPDNPINRHDAARNAHTGSQYGRPQLSDCFSDSDLSKPSTSPRNTLSFMKVAMSPSTQKMAKSYRRFRSCSLPRSLLTDANICNSVDYNLAGCSLSDLRRTPSVYIEQDIINKQRQEIQLLMEELGNRDQELNDLVMSHQKQVKAWESDNEKLVALQGRLSHYEEELRMRENQLKETLSEMARVNEQREVDAVELKQTQNEMIKLAERIMENSLYIKEMESQNQKLSHSLRDFINARQSFSAREQELLLLIQEKDASLSEREKEIAKMVEHIKYLECQCEQLGERNNNTVVESVNWRKKYLQVKEDADRLSAECRLKEENVQKMTQQLHESLQQAIALQKALFTSCEREKCKEEVMYSLRKQHKRTMQELQNIRELYDRLSRDTTLYHLSVKEKDNTKDLKKKEDLEALNKRSRGGDTSRHEEEAEKRRQSGSRRHESTLSKLKHPEASEQSFLVKETKERRQMREEKSGDKSASKPNEKNTGSCGEQKLTKTDGNKGYKGKVDETEEHPSKLGSAGQTTPQKLADRNTPKLMKNEQQVSTPMKSCHTTMCRNAATITSSTTLFSEEFNAQRARVRKSGMRMKSGQGDSETGAAVNENISRNADYKDSRCQSISTAKSVQSQTTSSFSVQQVLNKHDASILERNKDGGDSSSDASNIVSPSRFDDELTPADSDGMCYELQRDVLRVQHLDRLSPMLEASGFESRSSRTPSNSLTAPKKSSFLKKDKTDKKESSAAVKQNMRKRSVEFDACEDLTKSVSAETQSQYLGPDSESYSPPTAERRPGVTERGNAHSKTQQYGNYGCQSSWQSQGVREENRPQHGPDLSALKTHPVENGLFQKRGQLEPEQRQENDGDYCHKNNLRQMENSVPQWSDALCSQCKVQGKGCCNCCLVQRNHSAFANQMMANVEGDSSKHEVRYSSHGALAPATSKMTFSEIDSLLEYNSVLSRSQNHQLQAVDRIRVQVCSSPDEANSSALHHSDQKSRGSLLEDKPVHDQSVVIVSHKVSGQDLPERITTYLANHSAIRREMYNNNNNKCTDNIMNFDPGSCSEMCRQEMKAALQDGNLATYVDDIFDCSEEDGLPDSVMLPSDSEDMPDYSILNGKKIRTENDKLQETCSKNVFQEAVGNKKAEINPKVCFPTSSGCDSEQSINDDTGVGSSEMSDRQHVPGLIPKTGSQDDQPERICCHPTTRIVMESHFPPSEFVLNSSCERPCNSICGVKGKQSMAFVKAASAPTCKVFNSASTREPSLYKHLSLIHFSETSRRYEWVKQPALLERSIHAGDPLDTRSHDHVSTKHQPPDLRSCDRNHTVCGQYKDSLIADTTDSRSDSQSSDSGHYSFSVESADPPTHPGKPTACTDLRSAVKSCQLFQPHKDQEESSDMGSNIIINHSSEQHNDPYNKHSNINNSNVWDISHLPFSPTERSILPHSSLKKFDSLVKKLDFNDPVLEDSGAENGCCFLSLSGQQSLPACSSDEGTIPDRFAVKTSPAATSICQSENESSCLFREGRCAHTLQSIICGSPEYIDPAEAVSSHDRNIPRLIKVSRLDLDEDLQAKCEPCGDVKEKEQSLVQSSEDVDIEKEEFSSQNRHNICKLIEMDEDKKITVECSKENNYGSNFSAASEENNYGSSFKAASEEDLEVDVGDGQFVWAKSSRTGHVNKDILVSQIRDCSVSDEDCGNINNSHRQFYFSHNQRKSHPRKHSPVPEGQACDNNMITSQNPEGQACDNNMITSQNPWRQEDVQKHQPVLQGTDIDHLNVQHYNLALHRAVGGIREDIRDSYGSVDCQSRGAAASSVEELAEKCDDSPSASLSVSSRGDESWMRTAPSPVSRLYQLLVESQEMINSLEKNSSGLEGVELEMPPPAIY